MMPSDETHYSLLKLLEERPDLSQRQLAGVLGVSLGKVNYCLKSLIGKGLVKAVNFRENPDKRAYAYLLTPQGITTKARLTAHFLKRKMAEYEALREEIEQLRQEAAATAPRSRRSG
jgi:EPS-associated MarR family transcriptional regulator